MHHVVTWMIRNAPTIICQTKLPCPINHKCRRHLHHITADCGTSTKPFTGDFDRINRYLWRKKRPQPSPTHAKLLVRLLVLINHTHDIGGVLLHNGTRLDGITHANGHHGKARVKCLLEAG